MLWSLMVQSTPKTRISGWSPERRARQATAIRNWSPWSKSTGPRTASGKARAAQNACKHGMRSCHIRLLNQALKAQRQCVRLAALFLRLRKLNRANELLARLRSRIHLYGHIFDIKLYQALQYERLCKNLAFSGSFRQIVNVPSVHSTRRDAAGMTGTVLKGSNDN